MARSENHSFFPAPWLVLPPAVPFIALAAAFASEYFGARLLSHGSNAAGVAVGVTVFVLIVLAAVVELGAVVVALVALWRKPAMRTAPNLAALVFGIIAMSVVVFILAVPGPWLR